MATFSGMGFPIVPSPRGYFPVTEDVDLLKGDLLILLLTNPGERVMMPQYGTPLRTLLFDPNDHTLADKARSMIVNSIATWEPRVIVDAINISNGINTQNKGFLNPNDDMSQAGNILAIQILFRYPGDIQSVQELVLQVPLQGGNNANST
jgi:phage baseplate assembly protein W